jgi:hypothetical protein
MLSLLMLAAGVASAPHSEPSTALAHVELFARTTSTRFIAVNPTDLPQMLVFSDARGILAKRVLPARGAMDERFPSGTTDGLSIQIVVAPDVYQRPSWRIASAPVLLSELEGYDAVRWSTSSFDPASLLAPLHFEPVMSRPHVPVPLPDHEPRGNLPPRLEEFPPPPI